MILLYLLSNYYSQNQDEAGASKYTTTYYLLNDM